MSTQPNPAFLQYSTTPTAPEAVRGVLDPLAVPQQVKATIWDSYYGANSPLEFKQRFDSLAIPQDVKAKLWDLKFGSAGVPSQIPNSNHSPLTRSLQRISATHEGMLEGVGATLPGVGAMVASPIAAAGGLGLLGSAGLTGLGAAGGEATNQLIQHALGSSSAPQTSGEAATRIGAEGLGQAGIEAGFGLAGKAVGAGLRGIAKLPDAVSEQVARLNAKYGLNLTAPELTGRGKWLQRIASTGLLGQSPAIQAQAAGIDNAKSLIDSELNLVAPQTTPQATGSAIQSTLQQNAKSVSDVLGGRVRQAAGALKGQQVDISPLKQWAQQELGNANVVNQFMASSGPSAAEQTLAKSLGYQSVDQAKQALPASAWQSLLTTAQQVAPTTSSGAAKNVMSVLGKPERTVEGVLRDIMRLPDQVPFEVANKFKQDLFDLNPTMPSAFADKATAVAKTANGKLTSLMEGAVNGTPEGQAWIDARGKFRTARQVFSQSADAPYQGKLIQDLLKSPPSELTAKIKSVDDVEALRKAVVDYGNIGGAQQALEARSTWSQFQRQYVQGLLKNPEASTSATDLFGLKARMDKVGPQTLGALFSNNPQALNNLKLIAEATSRYQKLGNVNTLGATIAIHGVAGLAGAGLGYKTGGDATSALEGAAIFEAVPLVLSKMIYNRAATELFIHGLAGLAAESGNAGLSTVGRAGLKAAPFAGSAMANIYRAFQLANQSAPQAPPIQSGGTPQSLGLPAGNPSPFTSQQQ